MGIPNLQNISGWQTAYTKDQAYRDSNQRRLAVQIPLALCLLFLGTALAFVITQRPWEITLPGFLQTPLMLGIIIGTLCAMLYVITTPFWLAKTFFLEFYRPPEEIDPKEIIKYRLWGKPNVPPPFDLLTIFQFKYLLVRDGEMLKKDEWPGWMACNLGGPLMLVVFDGCALYLERGNRFSRVVGPGDKVPFLEWYETIKYVVDLRPKVKTDEFKVWTKDGIKIGFTVQIECRIGDPAQNPPAAGLVYPYDPQAIKRAVERYALRWPEQERAQGNSPTEFTWVDAAWGQVTGILPGHIGSRSLNDLFVADLDGGQILSPEVMRQLFDRINAATQNFGVYVTDLQILKIDLPPEVIELQRGSWLAEHQKIVIIRNGQAKAFNIRSQEKARAEAQRDLIIAITEGLQKNRTHGAHTGNPIDELVEPLILSLSGMLEKSLGDPASRAYLARETLETFEKIQGMLNKEAPDA